MIDFFQLAIESVLDETIDILNTKTIFGGDINLAAEIQTDKDRYFIKWQNQDTGNLFEGESAGLDLLRNNCPLRIPNVIGSGKIGSNSFLILEFIQKGYQQADFWKQFGEGLAHLHAQTNSKFGLSEDNYIGRLPQPNHFHSKWEDFFVENRIGYQLKYGLDLRKIPQRLVSKIEKLFPLLEKLLPKEKPALLHGDLWSGNFLCDLNGKPTIYDPATYYGHREAELAFTQLFGGFDEQFYQTYEEVAPLEPGFEERIDIYNIYPLLVHANLFGGSYLQSVERIVDRFI